MLQQPQMRAKRSPDNEVKTRGRPPGAMNEGSTLDPHISATNHRRQIIHAFCYLYLCLDSVVAVVVYILTAIVSNQHMIPSVPSARDVAVVVL